MSKEVIAGIDPSTSTGVCILVDGKVEYVDVLKIKKKGWDNGRAYAYFADSLTAIFIEHGVQVFGVETKIPMGAIASKAASHDIASVLFGRTEEIAARLNIEMLGVAIQSWRSVFLRTTVAPKNMVVPDHIAPHRQKEHQGALRKRWWKQKAMEECERRGIKVPNDDAAEACGIAHYVYSKKNPLGWAGANDLFDLDKTVPDRPAGTLALKNDARSEAEQVFEKFE